MDGSRPVFLILLLRNPHLLKGVQGGKDRAPGVEGIQRTVKKRLAAQSLGFPLEERVTSTSAYSDTDSPGATHPIHVEYSLSCGADICKGGGRHGRDLANPHPRQFTQQAPDSWLGSWRLLGWPDMHLRKLGL